MTDPVELVPKLTLEQKVRLLTGADFWSLHPEPAVGLRRLVVSDGPVGVRGEAWDERSPSANVPSPTALAATWDEAQIHRIGGVLAAQAREKGVDVLLAPTVNLHRSPFGGRHFECFSEDPLLSARAGVAYVRGVQDGGVAATVKHFVANDSETERMTLDARVAERPLRELYLAPFEAIVRDGRVWAVMAAYNGVNGHTMTESPMLRDILHGEWGFDGLVMSDWMATRSTDEAGRAALDLAMPGPMSPWGAELVAAVRAGRVDEELIDDKVRRLLRLAARVGALEGAPAPAAPPSFTAGGLATELRSAAAAGFVLVRNENAALPVRPDGLRVAVLGPNAATGRTLGGGSATVFPPYVISPVDGIRAAAGAGATVTHAPGVAATGRVPVAPPSALRLPGGAGPGAQVRFLDAGGAVLGTEERLAGAYTWLFSYGPGIPAERVARIEVRTTLVAQQAGTHRIGCSGLGSFRLAVGGAEVVDTVLQLPPGADIVVGLMSPPQALHTVTLAAGEAVDLLLVHELGGNQFLPGTVLQLNLETPHGTEEEELARAVALAREADVAVVVVGTTEEVESEGFDRTSLALPGRQDDLVRQVAAANPRTVVVVNAGAPVLLPWAEEVAAVLLAWFPGQEFGNALADVLFGLVEPGGRLPTSWPATPEGLPRTQPRDGVLTYDEGLFIGYRWYDRTGRAPRYRFGHGLGYTTWEYTGIEAGTGSVSVRVRNTGEREGREVVQVYASRPESAVERPVRWLVGFAPVVAAPGDEVSVAVTLHRRAFEHWDAGGGGWVLEPGTYRLEAGRSSGDLRLAGEITLHD
jgi:beta-glucosidase